MLHDEFDRIFEETVEKSRSVLASKSKEYATEDKLHNFKVAAITEGVSNRRALGGMMVKHTVSIYDLLRADECADLAMWDEKIGDHINYLILLRALVIEELGDEVFEAVADVFADALKPKTNKAVYRCVNCHFTTEFVNCTDLDRHCDCPKLNCDGTMYDVRDRIWCDPEALVAVATNKATDVPYPNVRFAPYKCAICGFTDSVMSNNWGAMPDSWPCKKCPMPNPGYMYPVRDGDVIVPALGKFVLKTDFDPPPMPVVEDAVATDDSDVFRENWVTTLRGKAHPKFQDQPEEPDVKRCLENALGGRIYARDEFGVALLGDIPATISPEQPEKQDEKLKWDNAIKLHAEIRKEELHTTYKCSSCESEVVNITKSGTIYDRISCRHCANTYAQLRFMYPIINNPRSGIQNVIAVEDDEVSTNLGDVKTKATQVAISYHCSTCGQTSIEKYDTELPINIVDSIPCKVDSCQGTAIPIHWSAVWED